MSPDTRWFWDGAQWRPIPQHEAAFPSWKALGEGFVPPVSAPAPAAPLPGPPAAARRAAAPAPAYRIAGPAPDVAVPLWRRGPAPTGLKKYANIAAGAIAVIVVGILASLFIPPVISSRQPVATPTAAPTAQPGPQTRSDAARLAYLFTVLDAPVADLKDEFTSITPCGMGMTSSCQDALNAIAITAGNTLPVLEKAPTPGCVAGPVANVRADIAKASTGAQQGLTGIKQNHRTEFLSGFSVSYAGLLAVQSDYARVKSLAATCSSEVTGP